MKLSALHQSYLTRQSNTFRGSAPLDSASDDNSPATVFWLLLHGLCCLISLFLGFRFSLLVFFFLFSTSSSKIYPAPFRKVADLTVRNLELSANPIEVSLKQTKKPCQSR
ncbi:hypothetical protein PS1_045022 [Malus domestica]